MSEQARREYQRQWHLKNRERRLQEQKERQQAYYQWFRDYKSTLKCCRCGFSHPAALDFHHRDQSQKETEINRMVANKMSKEKVLAEAEKCDVLCANCHRIEHWGRRTIG